MSQVTVHGNYGGKNSHGGGVGGSKQVGPNTQVRAGAGYQKEGNTTTRHGNIGMTHNGNKNTISVDVSGSKDNRGGKRIEGSATVTY